MSDNALSVWVGRTEEVHDHLSLNLVTRIAATLGETAPQTGEPLPALWQWCFFQPTVEAAGLGGDGHPARGGFLPPADNRNRMWAGGRVEFHTALKVGAKATRISTITDVQQKQGKTGLLLFVTVQHDYLQDGQLAIREEQDIVYREPSPPKLTGCGPLPEGTWQARVTPTATLLFRYSAVTFNGHRIHYDWPYATDVEGYPGLVVHGPLIATLALRAFCRANPDARPRHFSYRGVRPLIAPHPFEVGGRVTAPGKAELWAGNADGVAQQAEVSFD